MIPSSSPSEKIQIMGAKIAVVVRKKEGTVVAEKKDGCHVVQISVLLQYTGFPPFCDFDKKKI